MAHPVAFLADPGIDGAFAIALALADPNLEVLGVAATAGNIAAEKATENVQIVVEQIDPTRWPRLGAALPVEYDTDGTNLHGPDGLGGAAFPVAKLHHPLPADKLLVDLVHQHKHELTIICLGPLTGLAAAIDREPELPKLVHRIICMGGSWHEPGNASATAEFHFFCDPLAARQVLRSGAPITLIPLDVSRKLLLSPTDLLELPNPESRTCVFLRQIVPFAIRATSNLYGIEGFHLKDVLGVAAASLPNVIATKSVFVDVETSGELTRGMSVVDTRSKPRGRPNVELAVSLEIAAVRNYIQGALRLSR